MAAPTPMAHAGKPEVTPQQIQKLLDENAQLIKTIVEIQNVKGKSMDCIQYQQTLHRNLLYLAGLADPRLDLQSILPPPGSNLLQSQRAPMPQSSASTQSMTPPPSSMSTTGISSAANMARRPHLPGTSVAGGMTASSQPTGMAHWGDNPAVSSMRPHQQIPGPGQYPMKGYAPGHWLSQGGPPPPPPGPYGMGSQAQVRMQMEEQQRRHLLRMHQEQLIQNQQARRMQQQASQATPPPPGGIPGMGGMYPPPPPPAGPGGGYMGGQPPMSVPYSQPPGLLPPNMPQMEM